MLLNSMIEFVRQQNRRRILEAHKFQVENGNAVISTPPYGYSYQSDTKSYKVNKIQAMVIQDIFSLFLKGTNCSQIADYLNDKGIKSKLGNLWTGKSIINIIKNPFYCGYQRLSYVDLQDNKEVRVKVIQKSNKILALISEEEYQAAQAILKN